MGPTGGLPSATLGDLRSRRRRGLETRAERTEGPSGEDALDHVRFLDAGEPHVEAAEGVGEVLVVDAEEWSIVAWRSRRWTGFSAML